MLVETYLYRDKKWITPEPKKFSSINIQQQVVFIFADPQYFMNDRKFLDELLKRYPHQIIIGCSTAGEIHEANALEGSLTLCTLEFQDPTSRVQIASIALDNKQEVRELGKTLAQQLASPELKSIFVLSEGLNINGTQLVAGLNDIFPPNVIVTGGLSGDGSRFSKTYLIQSQEVGHHRVVAIGFYGPKIKVRNGSKGGWDIFGPERTVTKSFENIVYEFDGEPALKLYKKYLGVKAQNLPASGLLFPIQVRKNKKDSHGVVRTILSVNQEEQSLTFAGDVAQGSLAQLMRANFDRLIDGAGTAATLMDLPSHPSIGLCIAVSCIGRRLVLGERVDEEIESVRECLPNNIHLLGYYSYGEISPYIKGDPCALHNQTMTLTTILED